MNRIAIGVLAVILACSPQGKATAGRSEGRAAAFRLQATACFDGGRAMNHVRRVVGFAPRHAGTPGLDATRDYIVTTLRSWRLRPVVQRFWATTPHPKLPRVRMGNVYVDIGDTSAGFVLVGGHFDGKLLDEPFPGANDGGSSTGVLLEMARCLAQHPPSVPVRLVFFDGEEALVHWSDTDSLYGSKHYVMQAAASGELARIRAMVNVDMVGDADLRFERDVESDPEVLRILEAAGRAVGAGYAFWNRTRGIADDHIPFAQRGVRAADLIDFEYGPSNAYWHTSRDSLAHVSEKSLEHVGRLVIEALPALYALPTR